MKNLATIALVFVVVSATGCAFIVSEGGPGNHDSRAPNLSLVIEPQDPAPGEDVTVDTERSTDPQGDVMKFDTQVRDPTGEIIHEYRGHDYETTFQVRMTGTHEIRVVAIDEDGNRDSQTANVTVRR